jgi:hypothetical protein
MESTTLSLPDVIPDSAWLLGLQFICEDDAFTSTPAVTEHYAQLPKKGQIYTLNEVHLGFGSDHSPVYAGNFEELPLRKPGGGFFLRRFRPLINDAESGTSHWQPDRSKPCSILMSCLDTFTCVATHWTLLGRVPHSRLDVPVCLYQPCAA